ncbi:hypothetical protein NKG94_05820 [Micromonospora sp. M12]
MSLATDHTPAGHLHAAGVAETQQVAPVRQCGVGDLEEDLLPGAPVERQAADRARLGERRPDRGLVHRERQVLVGHRDHPHRRPAEVGVPRVQHHLVVTAGGQRRRVDEADTGDDAAGRQLTALRVEQQQHTAAIRHRGGGHLHEDLLSGPTGHLHAAVAPARVTSRSTSPAVGRSRCAREASWANAT